MMTLNLRELDTSTSNSEYSKDSSSPDLIVVTLRLFL